MDFGGRFAFNRLRLLEQKNKECIDYRYGIKKIVKIL